MHYLLFYEAGDDYVARRAEFRAEHLAKAWESSARGELVLGGALADPVDGAVLLFRGDSPEVAEKFATGDPYVTRGLVKKWQVREWTTVAGEGAAKPIRPAGADSGGQSSAEGSNPTKAASELDNRILRIWKGCASLEKAEEYYRHVTQKVFPQLGLIKGHRGAGLLRRKVEAGIEFAVLTFWDSMAAVREFAGADPERAVVEPAARAVLSQYDDKVTHFEVAHWTEG